VPNTKFSSHLQFKSLLQEDVVLVWLSSGLVDLTKKRCVWAAAAATDHVLSPECRVVLALLHHKVDRRPGGQVLLHRLEILQHVRVLDIKPSESDQ